MDAHTTQQPAQYHPLQDAPHDKAQRFQDHQPPYEPYQPPHSDVDDGPAPATGPTLLSVSRAVALTVLAVVLFLLVAVIGLSAGLGVSQRDLRQVKGDLEAAQAVLSFASTGYVLISNPNGALARLTGCSAPTSLSATPTSTISSATATSTPGLDTQCPRANGTVYTASTGGKRFQRFCGLDYGGKGEATDIGSVKTRTMDACMDACASRGNCTGAGWGAMDGDTDGMHSCWMKTNLNKSHKATPDWGFAVLVQTAETRT